MSALSQFFLGSSPALVQLDLLEISHPNFSASPYYLVANAMSGVTVTHEGPAGPFTYQYLPMKITPVGNGSDLSQSLNVTMGDLGSIIQTEIANVTAANRMNIRPVAKFRCYSSSDLTLPMFGPLVLEISSVTTSEEGNTFECHAPKLNISQTGQRYTKEQFPMLSGFFAQ